MEKIPKRNLQRGSALKKLLPATETTGQKLEKSGFHFPLSKIDAFFCGLLDDS